MTKAVLDTNVLVSALLTKEGNSAKIVMLTYEKTVIPCYDWRLLSEYGNVLRRPKFNFLQSDIDELLNKIKFRGILVIAPRCELAMIDDSDRKFYEVAIAAGAYLITGNLKHFPKEPRVVSPSDFLSNIL
jgi:putative PIN family toxin of toxin-antitoxin system